MDGIEIIAPTLAAGIVVGAALTAVWLRRRYRRDIDAAVGRQAETAAMDKRLMEERLDVRARSLERAEAELDRAQGAFRELSEQHEVSKALAVRLQSENNQLSGQLNRVREETVASRSDAQAAKLQLTEIRTQLAQAEKGFREKEALFKEASDGLKKEFQLLANQIFEHHGQKLRSANTEQLTSVLKPFKEQITDFKRKVEEVYTTDAKDRASLLTEVRNLQDASERVNREAENLTRALKGDTRVQGNWGEVVLERVLTDSGLRRDHEYVVQASLRN
ncbi:MAG: DNA recombination protein RmuC, partial [Gammaproteobacteria bacterium]|nr:DNA recombination protein RmuC [Gammaproteobacteria bacterium]